MLKHRRDWALVQGSHSVNKGAEIGILRSTQKAKSWKYMGNLSEGYLHEEEIKI